MKSVNGMIVAWLFFHFFRFFFFFFFRTKVERPMEQNAAGLGLEQRGQFRSSTFGLGEWLLAAGPHGGGLQQNANWYATKSKLILQHVL